MNAILLQSNLGGRGWGRNGIPLPSYEMEVTGQSSKLVLQLVEQRVKILQIQKDRSTDIYVHMFICINAYAYIMYTYTHILYDKHRCAQYILTVHLYIVL